MTEQQMIEWIDNASYEQLLSRWRHAPAGDPFFDTRKFDGRVTDHYEKVMREKREQVGHEAAVAASKRIGW